MRINRLLHSIVKIYTGDFATGPIWVEQIDGLGNRSKIDQLAGFTPVGFSCSNA